MEATKVGIREFRTDLAEYIADRLHAIDELIYVPEDFDGFHEVEELARAQIANGSIALACRSNADIEQVQRQLQRIYGQRLGILIFEDGSSAYSVRQVDRNLPVTLERAYERLNLLDPAVTGGSENRWSGSTEIGVSPRKTGTGLTPAVPVPWYDKVKVLDSLAGQGELRVATQTIDIQLPVPRLLR